MIGRQTPSAPIIDPAANLAPDLRAMYHALVCAADAGEPCPSNNELADLIRVVSPSAAAEKVRNLEQRGLITVQRGTSSRVVTITATGKSTAGPIPAPHWREQYLGTGLRPPPKPRNPAATISATLDRGADLAARIDADQAAQRARREHWLAVEQQKYRLPRRGRLIEEMPA